MTICITTRFEYQARNVQNCLRREFPRYKTERDGRSVTTEAPSGTVRDVANACSVPQDSRWITVAP